MSKKASSCAETVWPSGLRRWLKAPVRKGVGSNPTAVIYALRVALVKFLVWRIQFRWIGSAWGDMQNMDTLGIEPRAFRMRSGCDTTTPCARHKIL